MKKQIKKVALCILSTMLVQTAAILPAGAAPTDYSEADFDNNSYTVTAASGKMFNQINFSGFNATAVSEEDTTTWAEKTLEFVEDPKGVDSSDRAMKINLNENTQKSALQFFEYIDGAAGAKQVYEISVMFDARVNNYMWMLNDDSWKNIYLLQFVADGDYVAIKNKFTDTNIMRLEYNKWYNIQTVVDFTSDDYTKYNVTVYINGEEAIPKTPLVNNKNWSATSKPKAIKLVINTNDKTWGDRHMYIDDWKRYTISSGSETQIAMPDYSDSAFMNGKKIRLRADSYIGNDNDLAPVNKVVYYDNGEKIAECTQSPFEYGYAPQSAGLHTITAEAYTAANTMFPITSAETSVLVEPKFREEYIMKEDFTNYVDGTTNWNDAISGNWRISNAASPAAITVDEKHGKSLYLGMDNGRALNAFPNIKNGSIKISGEYYFNTTGNNNTMIAINDGKRDINSVRVHGAMNLLDVQNANTVLQSLQPKKWYKIDIVTTVKNGQGYYTIYVDGKRAVQNPYAGTGYTSVEKIDKIAFLAAFNENAEVYVDNLSVSKIEYYDNTGFYCNNTPVSSIAEMTGNVLTAKSAVVSGNENIQVLAVYDKDDNSLKQVSTGVYDERTGMFTASCDIGSDTNVYAKVFIWNDMIPMLEEPELIQ